MPVTIAVARASSPTSTGNQDITTTDLGGLTPKAALFIFVRCTTDGSITTHAAIGIGAADGTRQWAAGIGSANAAATMDTYRVEKTDKCILLFSTTPAIDGEAEFVSFITNGVRINWTDATASARLLTVVFFAGDDTSVYASTVTPDNSVGNSVDVTAPAFEPDVVFCASHAQVADGSIFANAVLSLGIVTNEPGGVSQAAYLYHSLDNVADSAVAGLVEDGYAGGQINDTQTALSWAVELDTFDSQGFSVTTREGSPAGDPVCYLALGFNGTVNVWSDVINTPTSTGGDSQVGPGFQPQFVMEIISALSSVDSLNTGSEAGAFGIVTISPTAIYSNSIQEADAAATSDTSSLSDDRLNIPDQNAASFLEANFTSFDPAGWTLDFTATSGTARKRIALAIGAGGQPIQLRGLAVPGMRQWQPQRLGR